MKNLSIRTKLAIAVCLIVLLCITIVGAVSIWIADRQERALAQKDLSVTAQNIKQSLEHAYLSVSTDVSILSQIPAFHEFVESYQAPRTSQAQDETAAKSRQDLTDIFREILSKRPAYTQLRVIGIARNGRELLRADRVSDGIRVVPQENLQEKGGEFYFLEAMDLFDHSHAEHGEGSHGLYFSDVTLNRENGVVSIPKQETLRALQPVYLDDGTLFAFVVVNIDFKAFLDAVLLDLGAGDGYVIANETGDFYEFSVASKKSNLILRAGEQVQKPEIIDRVLAGKLQGGYAETRDHIYFASAFLLTDFLHLETLVSSKKNVTIITQLPKADAFAASKKILSTGWYLVAVLLAFAGLVTAAISRILTNPLHDLTQKVQTARSTGRHLSLPYQERSDEVGQLAQSFQDMAQHLEDSEEMNRTVLNAIGEGIITIDEQGIIVTCNPTCKEMFGYSAGECIGNNVSMLMPEPHQEQHDTYLQRYAETNQPKIDWRRREEIGRRKNGQTFPLELSVNQIVNKGKRLFVGVIRDITERRASEKAKSEFFATVSHELRTPLTSVIGALSVCLSNPNEELTQTQRAALEIAMKNSERLKLLINDILDIDKLNAPGTRLHFAPTDLSQVARKITLKYKETANHMGVKLEFSGTDKPATILGDTLQLERVFENLISNATKFSNPQDTVQVSVTETENRVRVSVADTGIGIPDSFKDKVFDRFTQHDSSDSRKYPGTGLGLSIAKTIVEKHHGTISFESEEGAGTVFHVDLPKGQANLNVQPAAKRENA